MAQQQLAFSKETLIDISKDAMQSQTGIVTVSGMDLILYSHSSATYQYTYDTSKDMIKSSRLQFLFDVLNDNDEASSRYNELVHVKAYVQYWEETYNEDGESTGFIEGYIDTDRIIPYFLHETKGYTNTYNINTDDYFINKITLVYTNDSDNTVTFKEPRMYYSMTIIEAIDRYGGDGGESGKDDPPEVETSLRWELQENDNYTIDTPFKVYSIVKKAGDGYNMKHATISFYGDENDTGLVYATTNQWIIIDNPNPIHVMGIRDGNLKCRIYYGGDGEHKGEYWIHELRIRNCNPGTIAIEAGHEINGFGATQLKAKMIPQAWVTDIPGYGRTIVNKNWISAGAYKDIDSAGLEGKITITQGSSVNGGQYVLKNSNNVVSTSITGNKGEVNAFAYGVYNGEMGITLKANRNIVDVTPEEIMLENDTLTVIGCEHDLILVANKDTITDPNDSVTIHIESVPQGVGVINTKAYGYNSWWNVSNSALKIVSQTGGNVSNPQVVLSVNYPTVSINNLEVVVTTQVEYANGLYKEISKTITLNYTVENGLEIESVSGTNKIDRYGAQLTLKFKNITNALSFASTVATLDTGTVSMGNYNTGSQTVVITGQRSGKCLVTFTNTTLQIIENFEVDCDYTEWLETIEIEGLTGELVLNTPYEVKILKLLNWVSSLTANLSVATIDGGTVSAGSFNTTAATFNITAQNRGKCTVHVANSQLVNWGIDIIVNCDYDEWLENIVFSYPTDNDNIEYNEETGICVIKKPETVVNIPLLNFNSNYSLDVSYSGYTKSPVRNPGYNRNTMIFYLTSVYETEYVMQLQNTQLKWAKQLYFKNDYTKWKNGITVISSTGSFEVAVGSTITISLSEYINNNSYSITMTVNNLDTGRVNTTSFNLGTFSFNVTGVTAGNVDIILKNTNIDFEKIVNITVV